MKKTGKTNKPISHLTLKEIFDQQVLNQSKMLENGMYDKFKNESTISIPVDDVKLMSYHIQQLVSEIGEVLAADKRWKNFRNENFNNDEKLEELADCFIVLMNVAMFSGFNGVQITEAIQDKINKVSERIGII